MSIFSNGFKVWHSKPCLFLLDVIYRRYFTIMWTPWIQKWQHKSTLHFGKGETEAQALALQVQGHTRRDRGKQLLFFQGCRIRRGTPSTHSPRETAGKEPHAHTSMLSPHPRLQKWTEGWLFRRTAPLSTLRQVSSLPPSQPAKTLLLAKKLVLKHTYTHCARVPDPCSTFRPSKPSRDAS